jgi:hypothetical protein
MHFCATEQIKIYAASPCSLALNFTLQRAFLENFKSCVLLIAGAIPIFKIPHFEGI